MHQRAALLLGLLLVFLAASAGCARGGLEVLSLADPPPGPRPIIIVVPGGSWHAVKTSSVRPYAERFARQGAVVVLADYGVLPWRGIGSACEDVGETIDAVVARATELGGDPGNVWLMGCSAGAHLSLLDATLAAPGQQPRLRGMVLLAPPSDTRRDAWPSMDVPLVGGLAHRYFFGSNPAGLSPLENLGSTLPPTLILHATGDRLVPINQSRVLLKRSLEAGLPVEVWPQQGGHHESFLAPRRLVFLRGPEPPGWALLRVDEAFAYLGLAVPVTPGDEAQCLTTTRFSPSQ